MLNYQRVYRVYRRIHDVMFSFFRQGGDAEWRDHLPGWQPGGLGGPGCAVWAGRWVGFGQKSPIGSNWPHVTWQFSGFSPEFFGFRHLPQTSILLVKNCLHGPSFLGGAPMNFGQTPEVSSEARQGSTRFDFSELETTKRRLEVPMGCGKGWHGLLGWERMCYIYIIYIYMYNIYIYMYNIYILYSSMICNCYVYMIYIYIYDTCI